MAASEWMDGCLHARWCCSQHRNNNNTNNNWCNAAAASWPANIYCTVSNNEKLVVCCCLQLFILLQLTTAQRNVAATATTTTTKTNTAKGVQKKACTHRHFVVNFQACLQRFSSFDLRVWHVAGVVSAQGCIASGCCMHYYSLIFVSLAASLVDCCQISF